MGCDIHAVWEYRNSDGKWHAHLQPNKYFGRWEDEPQFTARAPFNRDYDVFAILANVRNGHGFAGCDTGDGFVPMTEGRGLPDDITKEGQEACNGDHSDSWVSLDEILRYDWTRKTKHRGWVNAVGFEEWDRMKEWNPWPKNYCGGVSGTSIDHVSIQQMRETVKKVIGDRRGKEYEDARKELERRYAHTYCLIEWETTYADSAKHFWVDVMPIALKLGTEHGFENVRLVMNFDS